MSQKSVFHSQVGELVSLETAKEWIKNHGSSNAEIHAKSGVVINSYFFGKDAIQKLLDTVGAVGIRIHFAADENGAKKLVIFPANENGNDILIQSEDGSDKGLDGGLPCPPVCGIGEPTEKDA